MNLATAFLNSAQKNPNKIAIYFGDKQVSFTELSTQMQAVAAHLQKQFGVNALPTYILLGRDGAAVQKFVGEEMAESIVERVGPDLKKTLAAKP